MDNNLFGLNRKVGLVPAFFIALVLGCVGPGWGEKGGLTVSVHPPAGAGRTLAPALDWKAARYTVQLTGPAGEVKTRSSAGGEMTFEGLAAGTWTAQASAWNGAGAEILAGQGQAVAGRDALLTVVLRPLAGTGSLALTTVLPEGGTGVMGRLSALAGAGGTDLTVPWVVGAGTGKAEARLEAVASGYYRLKTDWLGTPARSAVEVVLVAAGQETTGVLTAPQVRVAGADVAVGLREEGGAPPVVSWSGEGRLAIPGAPLDLTAGLEGQTTPADWRWSWWLDGALVGTAARLALPEGPGAAGRLTCLGWAAEGSAAASRTVDLPGVPAAGPGGWRVLEDLKGSAAVRGLGGVRKLVFSAWDNRLYSAAYDTNELGVFDVDPVTGLTTARGRVASGVAAPLGGIADLGLSPDGRWLAAASRRDGSLVVFRLVPGGLPEVVFATAAGAWPGLTGVRFAADGRSLWAVSATAPQLLSWSFDPLTGTVGPATVTALPEGAGAEGLAVSPDGQWLAVCALALDQVLLYRLGGPGGPVPAGSFTDGQTGVEGLNGVTAAVFAADSRSLLTLGYYDAAVAGFTVDNGQWRTAGNLAGVPGLRLARDLLLAAGGRQVAVAGTGEDGLEILDRSLDGKMSPAGRFSAADPQLAGTLDGPRGLALSADGRFLWVASAYSNDLRTFWRKN